MKHFRWGILGTGAIARAFADGLQTTEMSRLVAVGSRRAAGAEAFVEEYPGTRAHGSYEELFADPEVDAVYVSAPHPFHALWSLRAMEAGKHVLCEKPMALNRWQGEAMVACARRNRRFLAEAFMYRLHPQTVRLVELLRKKAVGEVRMIRAAFGFGGGDEIDPESRLFNNALGGGAMLDVGCYPVSMARLVAGMATGEEFADPVDVAGTGHIGATGVDEWAAAVLRFSSGMVAEVATSVRADLDNRLEIAGAEGKIIVPDPWVANRRQPVPGKILLKKDGETEEIALPTTHTSFAFEADAMAAAIGEGRLEARSPGMTWNDTLGNLAVLDQWRSAVGMVYEEETPRPVKANLPGRPVRILPEGPGNPMRYGSVPGLSKPVSRFIFGALTAHGSFAKAQVLFDHWLECGGNAFDTGYIYRDCDKILGQWIQSRGVREDLVLITKGAHTPYCDPDNLARELEESLEKLQTGFTDIHIMHRDNEAIPVDEFIDVLHRFHEAGRIGVYGGSNWSPERFAAASEYARRTGKEPMRILNNNLSLARMVDPVWKGCIHMSATEDRAWMERNGIVHFAWSSQARGFFTDRAERERRTPGYDRELRRCWFSEDNFRRRERCLALAEKKGVLPINIAAAWVLSQPFESYALIGPETVAEMDSCLPALTVTLSREEIDWLWGEG
ncbi:MAG: Gfo/Idh/MocA family oxidoreductase [Verrucomicrobia bacterium]|jgi:predicted dehydrogenase/aryl-alcohol dehydrogenase-like predicted oxidoreductase|nr:Gfo/Idh/MocA family oxidoreductase [Verrucomicrobiota bacterium]